VKLGQWVILASAVVLALVLFFDVGISPRSWHRVRIGESYKELKREYPELKDGSAGDIPPDSYLIERRLLGYWITVYEFDGYGFVEAKTSTYHFGKDYRYGTVRTLVDGRPWKR
jgi:hypothetical protein